MIPLVSRTGRRHQRYYEGRRLIAGCIPYRYISNDSVEKKMEVLMISSQKGNGVLFPKGGWETDESLGEAVRREALEEAGVRGNVEDLLGEWIFKSKSHKDTYRVGYMFPLHVTEQLDCWPEKNVRERKWVTVSEARVSCQYLWMREALELLIWRANRPCQSLADSTFAARSSNSSDDSSSSE